MTGAAPEGMRVDIAVDSRFSTSPTLLKSSRRTRGSMSTSDGRVVR
ncbi:hypothetical protein [Nocardia abscessus]|nr:hypothetical protein [Nocardia abscessus]